MPEPDAFVPLSWIHLQGKCYLPLLMKPSQGSLVAPTPQVAGGDSFFLTTRVACTVVWLSARNVLHICGAEWCTLSMCQESQRGPEGSWETWG